MDNTSDGDASSLPVEVVSEVEALSTYLQDLDLGRRKQILEELVKHPLHELEHSLEQPPARFASQMPLYRAAAHGRLFEASGSTLQAFDPTRGSGGNGGADG